MTTTSSSAFKRLCTPGQNMFCVWGAAYAPPMAGAPAQLFLGEWTGNNAGADLIVLDPDSGRQQILGFDGIGRTQNLCVDPYRPVIWMSTDKPLYEIDRLTLKARAVAETTYQYSMDVDRQGRVWFAQTRSLRCFDPRASEMTVYPDITPDEYYYADGTYITHGVGPDGRIWIAQNPVTCLAVFDPVPRTTKIVWSSLETKNPDFWPGTPVAIGGLIWAGGLCADARTAELVEPPFPVTGDDAFSLCMRGTWNRTPTGLLDRQGSALVCQKRRVGWLEVASGRFTLVGELPDDAPADSGWSLHGEHTLISGTTRVDLKAKKTTYFQIKGPFPHAQGMFGWTVGPDNSFYGSCYSHDLWQVDQQGKFTNHGDVVQVHGGELHGFATWKNKLFIVSYTHSVLTRVDVTRPTNNWGKAPENNPRHIIEMLVKYDGHQRPGPMAVTPQGHVYFLSRTDYCTRREGALVVVDAETEEVLHVVDPLLPGEQLHCLAVSPTRAEAYIGSSRGAFVVWDTEAWKIKRVIRLEPLDGDGQMTSSMIELGGIRGLGAVGDLVIGTRGHSNGRFTCFIYHADTGAMDGPQQHPLGKVFGIFPGQHRGSLLLYINGALYEMDGQGDTRLVYPEVLPGFATMEGPDGRLYIGDGLHIYGETDPACQRHTTAPILARGLIRV